MRTSTITWLACLSVLIISLVLDRERVQAEISDLRFERQGISANLNQVSLAAVLEKISRERDFWFEAHVSALSQPISVRFKGLPFENALRRILEKTNFCLVSNEHGIPIGAIVLGQPSSTKRDVGLQHHTEPPDAMANNFDAELPSDVQSAGNDEEAVIIDASQVELLAKMAIDSGMDKEQMIPLAGMPEEFIEALVRP